MTEHYVAPRRSDVVVRVACEPRRARSDLTDATSRGLVRARAWKLSIRSAYAAAMRFTVRRVPRTTLAPLLAAAAACGNSPHHADASLDAPAMTDGAPASDAARDGTADATRIDAGLDVIIDTGPPPPCSGPGPSPDAWAMYGHDARRTSASNGCIHATLAPLWQYDQSTTDAAFLWVGNHVADRDAVYTHELGSAVPRVTRLVANTGAIDWHHDGSADYDVGNWPTLGLGSLLVVDDGVYQLDATTGMLTHTSGVDWWGQSAADDTRFYVVTSTHGDGPGAFVSAWDPTAGSTLWRQNQQGSCMPAVGDTNGALAVDGSTVFFAPRYATGGNYPLTRDTNYAVPSGVYALDAATGTQRWAVPTQPRSSISAGGGLLFLVEDNATLVARRQSDGAMAWSAALGADPMTVGSQPPVLAAGRVIVAVSGTVRAFDAMTGALGWTTSVAGADRHAFEDTTINFLSCPSAPQPAASGVATSLAAALASDTLVVTGTDAVHVLALSTGMDLGHGGPGNASNPVIVGDRLYVIASVSGGAAGLVALRSN